MQFTTQETKLIRQLRRQERQWRWTRWFLLGVSLFVFSGYGYIGVSLYHTLHWDNLTTSDVLFFALIWPKLLLMFCFGTWFVVLAICNWRGNPTRVLLLKLLDAEGQPDANENPG